MNATLAWEFISFWVAFPPILAAAMIAARHLTEALLARMVRRHRTFKPVFLPSTASMAVLGGQ